MGTGIPKDKDEVKGRECEDWVGAGVNSPMLSETLEVVGITETVRRPFWLCKNTMNLCVCDNEEREHGVGAGVHSTILHSFFKEMER